ncbi:hypothetical protein LCGC14_1057790 [marine sediment metagenome]|uniref:Uncharacterized protein n=1 Tax=marine sediment metagenome TaxID=412755 RepID=A0A0F9Q508_9ZZZZ
MNSFDLIAVAANTIFLVSYVDFTAHIFRKKNAGGISIAAITSWLIAFSLLAIYFYIRWNPLFFFYYAAGSIVSVAAINGWRRYR